jgi:hypothetical protein
MKKTRLALDGISVDSFQTAETPPERGTVQARGGECTADASCKCPTSIWACGTIASTLYSCPQTFDC